ncbi:putative lipid II flippase FtsW [Arthrobacter sp. lap29]|uniref:putative lipid II flippase FtsW n=1 Tax=Arthrobacter sp. lap29 TaxID=3056122 RepID=UPI0028F6D1C0|nr:putative lipid II flippase FtsW [Arthrobacter sp. lap29]
MAKTPAQPRSSAKSMPAMANDGAVSAQDAAKVSVAEKGSPARGKASLGSAVKSGAGAKGGGPVRKPLARYRNWFNSKVGKPTASYYWIIGTAIALTMIGRMTVLSASTAETISKGQDPYDLFIKESGFAVVGLVLMFLLSCVPRNRWKKFAPFLLGLAVLLLILVFTPLGVNVQGNLNWLSIAGLQFQPSEAAKLALAIWMGAVLAAKGRLLRKLVHVLVPAAIGAGAIILLILLGHDLGTAVIVGMMVIAGLWFAGVPKRFLALAMGAAAIVVVISNLTSDNRTGRFASWLGDCSAPGACDQYLNGAYALASGGWFGVGLGQSRQKWNWIPEAHNDFIFAIIGEEFGLLGSILIVGLYAVLAFSIFRVINSRNDPFSRIVCGMILTWIIGQAIVNIGVVVGLLPVFGVPLPLISYGGTALIMVLAGVGVVLSFSRTEPESSLKTS